MRGINLHSVVDSALADVQPSVDILLYQSVGQENIKGIMTPKFSKPIECKARWQSESEQTLKHIEKINDSDIIRKVYLYYNEDVNPSPISRPIGRTGDYIYKIDDDSYWLITGLKEDYSAQGWVSVRATRQTKKPEFYHE